MRQTIRELEELSINAFPALHTQLYDGWVLRFSNGYTNRGNSVNPLYASKIDLQEKLINCEEKYFSKGLACVYKLTEESPDGLDALLSAQGYQTEKTTDVMTMELRYPIPSPEECVHIECRMSAEWAEGFLLLNGVTKEKEKDAEQMLRFIQNPVFCASVLIDNELAACGLGVLENGMVGLFDIRVREDCRRQGIGRRICSAILNTALNCGAAGAYLQVLSSNEPAIRLYRSLGFTKAYTYWYRVKQAPTT